MKRVLRKSIFESNSSSMHTVSIDGKRNINKNYTGHLSVAADGIMSIYIDEYGWNGDPCGDFYSKLPYAMCMLLHTEYPGGFRYWNEDFVVDQKTLESLDGYKLLLYAIKLHIPSCNKIIIRKNRGSYYPYGYIDHQSEEDYDSLKDFFDNWDVDAERFLFDDGVTVWIDNDNH